MAAYYNEWDPFAAEWLRGLIRGGLLPEGEVDERSILDVDADDLRSFRRCHFFAGIGGWPYALSLAGWPEDEEVWTGSPPCQPLSVAGQQKGHVDERHLWPAFYRLVAERRPSKFFGEQVASQDGREWFAGVRADLEAGGYAVGAAIMPACSVGAPHRRERLFFVGDATHGQSQEHEGDGASSRWRAVLAAGTGAAGGNHERAVADAGCRHEGERCDTDEVSVERDGEAGSADTAGRSGTYGGAVADAAGQGAERDIGKQGGARSARRVEPSQCGGLGLVVDAECVRPQNRSNGWTEPRAEMLGARHHSPWDDAAWIVGADGKARRVKSGLRLLAHGLPARVGRLRGYGNAIVPQVAAAFVRAFMEA